MANRRLDLSGEVFGDILVVEEDGRDPAGNVMWKCVCSCGNVLSRAGSRLKRGNVKSCGHPLSARRTSRVGEKHWQLTVLEELTGAPHYLVKAQCDCGRVEEKRFYAMTTGGTRRCSVCKIQKGAITRSEGWRMDYRLHCTYKSMLARCLNPRHSAYANYGGRGITVCDEWKDPKKFTLDMSPRPPGTTLERKKNHLGYSLSNCVWATPKQQLRNTRVNINLTVDGDTLCVAAWSELLGIHAPNIYARVKRNGITKTEQWLLAAMKESHAQDG